MKTPHIIALVVVAILAIGGTWYFVAKKKKEAGLGTGNGNGNGDPVQQPPPVAGTVYTGAQMLALAKRLHTDMESVGFFSMFSTRDDEAWRRLATMDNQYVVGVNAAFNSLYRSQSGKSMTTWILEKGSEGGADKGYTKQAILYRLYDLNLY